VSFRQVVTLIKIRSHSRKFSNSDSVEQKSKEVIKEMFSHESLLEWANFSRVIYFLLRHECNTSFYPTPHSVTVLKHHQNPKIYFIF
jgi:hypothetical protein